MGKKNKNKRDQQNLTGGASTSQAKKRIKTSTDDPPPSPPPKPITVKYDEMPLNHKKKFYINDDCGSLTRYIEIISWIRTMGCLNGSVFEDIGNLNWSGDDYPVLEIEVIGPNNISAKFIIFKMNLYVVAFSSQNRWYQFHCDEIEIDTFEKLPTDFDGRYK